MPFAATLMDLEITIVSEVSQRKTNIKDCHLYVESKKMVQMDLFIEQKQTPRLRGQAYGCQGRKMGRGMNWEDGIGICTLLKGKQINKDLL